MLQLGGQEWRLIKMASLSNFHSLRSSVTTLGDFCELLGNKFSYKSIMINFGAILDTTTHMINTIWLLFGQYWEKLGNLLLHQLITLLTR